MITIDDFFKVEIKVGKVLEAVNKEGSSKLIRLTVDVGEENSRVIFTAVREFGFTPEDFADKKFLFVTNLEPKKIMDEESAGMALAVDSEDGEPKFISVDDLPVGATIR